VTKRTSDANALVEEANAKCTANTLVGGERERKKLALNDYSAEL